MFCSIVRTFPSRIRERSSSVDFLVALMPVLDLRVSIDRYSHVRRHYDPR